MQFIQLVAPFGIGDRIDQEFIAMKSLRYNSTSPGDANTLPVMEFANPRFGLHSLLQHYHAAKIYIAAHGSEGSDFLTSQENNMTQMIDAAALAKIIASALTGTRIQHLELSIGACTCTHFAQQLRQELSKLCANVSLAVTGRDDILLLNAPTGHSNELTGLYVEQGQLQVRQYQDSDARYAGKIIFFTDLDGAARAARMTDIYLWKQQLRAFIAQQAHPLPKATKELASALACSNNPTVIKNNFALMLAAIPANSTIIADPPTVAAAQYRLLRPKTRVYSIVKTAKQAQVASAINNDLLEDVSRDEKLKAIYRDINDDLQTRLQAYLQSGMMRSMFRKKEKDATARWLLQELTILRSQAEQEFASAQNITSVVASQITNLSSAALSAKIWNCGFSSTQKINLGELHDILGNFFHFADLARGDILDISPQVATRSSSGDLYYQQAKATFVRLLQCQSSKGLDFDTLVAGMNEAERKIIKREV